MGRPIVFVIGSARIGGAEGQMVRLACELVAKGEDVRFLFLTFGGPLTDFLDEHGVPWQVMRRPDWPPSSTGRNIAAYLRLAVTLFKLRPSVVCAWLAGAIWPALMLAQVFTGAKRIAGFRGEVFERDLRWQAGLFRRAVKNAHAVTINSPSLHAEAIRWGANPDLVHFIPNGVVIPTGAAIASAAPPTAVVVSNFRWYKGHRTLLDALSLLENPPRVRLCGEGEGKGEVAALSVELGLGQRVEFAPEPADIPSELARAQFAIHPSHTEGLSNAILEELAYGLPVVATDVGGTHLLVKDGINGMLVPPNDPNALAKAVSAMSKDGALRSHMGRQAKRHVSKFDWSACSSQYQQLFARTLGAR